MASMQRDASKIPIARRVLVNLPRPRPLQPRLFQILVVLVLQQLKRDHYVPRVPLRRQSCLECRRRFDDRIHFFKRA